MLLSLKGSRLTTDCEDSPPIDCKPHSGLSLSQLSSDPISASTWLLACRRDTVAYAGHCLECRKEFPQWTSAVSDFQLDPATEVKSNLWWPFRTLPWWAGHVSACPTEEPSVITNDAREGLAMESCLHLMNSGDASCFRLPSALSLFSLTLPLCPSSH